MAAPCDVTHVRKSLIYLQSSGYPQYIEQVRPELNGLFREEDYLRQAAQEVRRQAGDPAHPDRQ